MDEFKEYENVVSHQTTTLCNFKTLLLFPTHSFFYITIILIYISRCVNIFISNLPYNFKLQH